MRALAAAASSLSQAEPISCLIASSDKALPIHESLQQMERLSVLRLPVGDNSLRDTAEDVTGQMRDLNPRED